MPISVDVLPDEYERFEDDTERTRGEGVVHLTDIIKSLDQKDYSGVSWNMDLTADIGFIWERALERAYKEMLGIRPGEHVLDGVVCSPDGIGDDPWGELGHVDEEHKLTWKSSNSAIENNWYYMTQFKGYCKVLETTVTVARVLYVCGNYKGSGPIYRVYRIEYSEEEIDGNWKYLTTHARTQGWLK
jgi:hypothetical protein